MIRRAAALALAAGCALEEGARTWSRFAEERATPTSVGWTCDGADPRFEATATGGFFGDKRHVLVWPSSEPGEDHEKHELCDVSWTHHPRTDTVGATLRRGETPRDHECCVEDTAAPAGHAVGQGLTSAQCVAGEVTVGAWALIAEDGRDGTLVCRTVGQAVTDWLRDDPGSNYRDVACETAPP